MAVTFQIRRNVVKGILQLVDRERDCKAKGLTVNNGEVHALLAWRFPYKPTEETLLKLNEFSNISTATFDEEEINQDEFSKQFNKVKNANC